VNVLFDLDGTLTDPGDGFVACVSYALAKLSAPANCPQSCKDSGAKSAQGAKWQA